MYLIAGMERWRWTMCYRRPALAIVAIALMDVRFDSRI
jgi:hypothetical protein